MMFLTFLGGGKAVLQICIILKKQSPKLMLECSIVGRDIIGIKAIINIGWIFTSGYVNLLLFLKIRIWSRRREKNINLLKYN